MKYLETDRLEVKVLDDGAVLVRRKDRQRTTQADKNEACRLADSSPGITAADMLRIFPGSKIVSKR